ncbi:MAG: hypothetical protein M1826_005686 [Phylliscum demangeonii]|nr:MAG: hypothetical protein M1826_005686 [Phylliscum demangeonii]
MGCGSLPITNETAFLLLLLLLLLGSTRRVDGSVTPAQRGGLPSHQRPGPAAAENAEQFKKFVGRGYLRVFPEHAFPQRLWDMALDHDQDSLQGCLDADMAWRPKGDHCAIFTSSVLHTGPHSKWVTMRSERGPSGYTQFGELACLSDPTEIDMPMFLVHLDLLRPAWLDEEKPWFYYGGSDGQDIYTVVHHPLHGRKRRLMIQWWDTRYWGPVFHE